MGSDEDTCPFCGGLLHWYMRRETNYCEEEGSIDYDMVDYQECENCNKEPIEAGDYHGPEFWY